MDAPKNDKKTATLSSEAQLELLDTKTGSRRFLTLNQLKDLNQHECLKNHQARHVGKAKEWKKVNAITGDSSYANPKTIATKDDCMYTAVTQTATDPIEHMPRKVVIAIFLMLLLGPFLLIFSTSSEGPNETAQVGPAVSSIENVQTTPEEMPREKVDFTEVEKQIHGFILANWDEYQKRFNFEKAQALALIDASNEFNKTIFEVARIYDKIDLFNADLNSSDAENDFTNAERFRKIGFYLSGDKWLFQGQPVDMGVQLPMPESLKPKPPENGSEINVVVKSTHQISESKRLIIKGSVNLPDHTILMVNLACEATNYSAQDKTTVINGTFEAGPFSDSKRLYSRLKDGTYTISISTVMVSEMNSSVREVLGDKGRNLVGSFIVDDPILGKRVDYSETLVID